MLVPVPPNFCQEASMASVNAPPIPSRNPKVDGISLSLLRARQILQIHQETRKQPHECPERGSVAHRSVLYKLTSWATRGALCYGHQNGKVCCIATSIENQTYIVPRAFAFGRSVPAPSALPYPSFTRSTVILYTVDSTHTLCCF